MDHATKTKVLKQLARTEGKIAEGACENAAAKIGAKITKETRYDLLEEQIELLDIIAFRISETAVGIVRQFLEHLRDMELTHQDELGPTKDQLAEYQNNNHLIVKGLELLVHIRYHQPDDILKIFLDYSQHKDTQVKERANQVLGYLAEYNLDIYYAGENRAGLGPAPQLKILDWLEALDASEVDAHSPAIIMICDHLLSPTMGGTTWDYKSVTMSTGPIPVTDEIKNIRRRSLQLLKALYETAVTVDEKRPIINAMLSATRNPHMGDYGDDVRDMISNDTVQVLGFFKELLPEGNLQVVQKIEHDAFWRFRHADSDAVKAAALEIRDLLEGHDEYTIYKDLIGYEGVFEDWEESLTKKANSREIDEYRSAKAKKYAESIHSENWAEWRDRIIRFATTESNDLATFPNFYKFLEHLAETSPNLAFSFLTDNLNDIRFFTIPLIRGLWKGPRKGDLKALMLQWIDEGQQLIAITKLFLSNDDIDEKLLGLLLEKAVKDANLSILILMVSVAASNFADGREDLIGKFFLPAVESLTAIKDAGWIDEIWYRTESKDIISGLGEEGREIIFKGLLVADNIDYHADEILIPLAEDDPKRVIELFGERLRYEEENKLDGNYDAIPFQFYKLHETLAHSPRIAVDTVRSWFDDNAALFQYRGANLLKIIFPDFPEPFRAKLTELVLTGKRQDIEFVLSVLRNYEGEPMLHDISREIVAALPEGDDLLKSLWVALESTGVVTGPFGFAEACERKIEEIKPWLDDENEKVRNFATNYVTGLEKRAESERSRAAEEIELRKHAYGVREEEADEKNGASEQ